ncbi:MAG: polyprenyl synthetase family protein [Janthinobacterium lividum]
MRADDEIDFWKQAVECRLDVLMASMHRPDGSVCHAMHAGVTSSGKRIRALMLIGVGQGLGIDPVRLLDLACALEMVHAASLFLDDLPCMDDAKERRGQPALHLRFGESTALLASIGMLTHAFKTIAESEEIPVHLKPGLVSLLADTVGPCGLIQGQYRDLATSSGDSDSSALGDVNELKTGMLFKAAMLMPAMVVEADLSTLQAIARLASDVGQAFQLRDDLADGETTGNGAFVDLDGHATLVTALGPRRAMAKLEGHVGEAQKSMRALFAESQILAGLMKQIATLPLKSPPSCLPEPCAGTLAGMTP